MSISLNIIDLIESRANMFNICRGFKHCHLMNSNKEMQRLHSVPKKLTETWKDCICRSSTSIRLKQSHIIMIFLVIDQFIVTNNIHSY